MIATMNPAQDCSTTVGVVVDPVMNILASLPEENQHVMGRVPIFSSSSQQNKNRRSFSMEESWNGLFLDLGVEEHCCSNKKMGHSSFTDLGLYAKHNTTATGTNNNNRTTATLQAEDIQNAKSQFMKMRLQRLLKLRPAVLANLHQSDSALLLRKNSSMDIEDLDGAWFKAKHPRHCDALEKLAQSAPAGSSLDYFSSS